MVGAKIKCGKRRAEEPEAGGGARQLRPPRDREGLQQHRKAWEAGPGISRPRRAPKFASVCPPSTLLPSTMRCTCKEGVMTGCLQGDGRGDSESQQGRPAETTRFRTLGVQRGHQPRERQRLILSYTAGSGRAETTPQTFGVWYVCLCLFS